MRVGIRTGVTGLWTAGALSVVLMSAGGCQNKLYEENKALREQNREQQAKIDGLMSMQAQPAPLTPPDPVKPAAPEPKVATVTPPVDPVSPPATPAPSGPGDLGGEVTVDPVAGTTTVNFLGDALFDSGKATVKASAKTNLDKCAAALKQQYAGKPVRVQGHSDSDPIKHSTWKSNQALSEARAKAVRDYLVSKGVPASQINSEGFGEAKPKSSTDKSKNRRVEVVVVTR